MAFENDLPQHALPPPRHSFPPKALALVQTIIAGSLIFWFMSAIRRRRQQVERGQGKGDRGRGTAAAGKCCGDPNCLRCFPRTDALRANAARLRRLVTLEPGLFEDMRDEIWTAVDDTLADKNNKRSAEWKGRRRGAGGDYGSVAPAAPIDGQDPTVFLLPGLAAVPYHDADACRRLATTSLKLWKAPKPAKGGPPIRTGGDMEALRRGFEVVRGELLDYLRSDEGRGGFAPFDPAVYERADGAGRGAAGWSSIYLFRQGVRMPACRAHFPRTTDLLEIQCPHLMKGCGFGSAYFSRLLPNTKVTEHCGPTNVRLRCHLPVVVPEGLSVGGGSYLSVGLPGASERRETWWAGRPMLFDDSFLHSAALEAARPVSNAAPAGEDEVDSARIVLVVDFWHPDLSPGDRTALGVLYPPGS